MAVSDDFARMQALFGQFQEQIGLLVERIPPDDENAAQLRTLRQLLESKHQELTSAFQAENQRLDREMAELKARMEASKAEAAAMKEARQKEIAAAAAVAPAAETVVDPQLGEKLRALILKELKEPARKPAGPRKAAGEVADMQTSEFSADAGAPPARADAAPKAPAAPPRQPRKPKVGGDSFEWESTDEWENKGM